MEPYLEERPPPDDGRAPKIEAPLSLHEKEGDEGGEAPGASVLAPEVLTPEEVYFPPEYSRFVSRLAQAVQKHSMYPPAHPALRPAIVAARQALEDLVDDRHEISMEVARNQLAIDGAETDPHNPRFRSLAGLLHRHQLAAVTFSVGIGETELAEFLAAASREPERTGRTLVDDARDGLADWPNVRLHGIRYEALGISRGPLPERESDPKAASRLWRSLARAALEDEGESSPAGSRGNGGLDPEALAAAVERRSTEQEFATDLVGRLARLSKELGGGGADEDLRGRASRFVSMISPEALRRVLTLGGDAGARRGLVRSAAGWMEPASMVKLVRAAAGVERKGLSHTCLLLMMKLARYAGTDHSELGPRAEARLRDQIDALVFEWSVADAIPDEYGDALERMSAAATTRPEGPRVRSSVEPERVLQMSIELEKPGARLAAAVSELLEDREFSTLLENLDAAPPGSATAEAVWESLAGPETVGRILAAPEPDFVALDRVLARIGAEAVPTMLDVLIASESRAVRRHLFERIRRAGHAAGPHILRYLRDDRWYVRRNMLALLQSLEATPTGWTPFEHARDPHPAVRREALKMLLHDPRQRDGSIRCLLEEEEPRSIALGLGAALEDTPIEILPNLLGLVMDEGPSEELRAMAVRALAQLRAPESVGTLLDLVRERSGRLRRLLGRYKLAPPTPVMLEALAGLARHWWHEPAVRRALAAAERSDDPGVREAARGRRGP